MNLSVGQAHQLLSAHSGLNKPVLTYMITFLPYYTQNIYNKPLLFSFQKIIVDNYPHYLHLHYPHLPPSVSYFCLLQFIFNNKCTFYRVEGDVSILYTVNESIENIWHDHNL